MKFLLFVVAMISCIALRAQDVGADLFDEKTFGDSDLKEMEKMEDLELRELEKQISDTNPSPKAPPTQQSDEISTAPAPAPAPEVAPTPQLIAEPTPAPAAPVPAPAPELFTPPPQQVVEAPVVPAQNPDEPNADFEKRMALIYEDFFKTRTSDSEWQKVVGDRAQETYQVQSADTLWDLSEVLFGNGHFWTKLWSENKSITNPHNIEINDMVYFVGGELSAEPQIRVSGTEGEIDEAPEAPTPFQADVDIPRSARGRYLRNIPPSLPENSLEFGQYDNDGFELKRVARFHLDTTAPLQSYVTETPPNSLATLAEIPDGAETVQLGNRVLAQGDLLNVGDVLTAFRADNIRGEGASVVHHLGEFRVIEKVEEKLYRLQAMKLINQVRLGDSFIAGSMPRADYTPKGFPSEAALRLLDTGEEQDQRLFSDPGYVYLAGGSKQGVSEGQLLRIRKQVAARNADTLDLFDGTIGTVKVIRTEPSFSTGILVKSAEPIFPGDQTLGAGEVR